jgi:hypothetical protein
LKLGCYDTRRDGSKKKGKIKVKGSILAEHCDSAEQLSNSHMRRNELSGLQPHKCKMRF